MALEHTSAHPHMGKEEVEMQARVEAEWEDGQVLQNMWGTH